MGNIKKHPSKPGIINFLARPIGVELEYAVLGGFKVAVNKQVSFAHWEHDGTLTAGGEELVLVPGSGDQLMQYLTTIIGLQENYCPKVDKSCGFHVHVQSQDFTMQDLRRLIAAWCRIEPTVYGALVDVKRRNGREDGHHYCRPMVVDSDEHRHENWQFTPADVLRLMRKRLLETNPHSTSSPEERIHAALMKKLYGLDWGVEPLAAVDCPKVGEPRYEQKYAAYRAYRNKIENKAYLETKFEQIKEYKRTNNGRGGCRYAAMNVHSHFHRGTIEFRLKEGTLEAEEIIFWPLFCGWFVEAATRLRDDEVLAVHSLSDWVRLMRERCFMQPTVVEWVEGKLKR